MSWDDLSLSQKNEVIGMHVRRGITDLGAIRASYNSYREGGFIGKAKRWYNENVRTNPLLSRRPSFDATGYDDKDSAYAAARRAGNKTFVWDGGHYNTDYAGDHHREYQERVASGVAQEFSKNNPGLVDPVLRRAKQEELDLYGITNEFTRDKNFIERRLAKNVAPIGYHQPLSRVAQAIYFGPEFTRKHQDLIASDISDEDLLDRVSGRYDPVLSGTYHGAVTRGKAQSGDLAEYREDARRRLDLFGTIMGNPASYGKLSVSPYKPEGSKDDYYFTLEGERRPSIAVKEKAEELENALKTSVIMNPFTRKKAIKKLENLQPILDQEPGNHIGIHTHFGDFTVGITDEYESYYDKWDINPWGQGAAQSLLGKPVKLYDRFYKDGKHGEQPKANLLTK